MSKPYSSIKFAAGVTAAALTIGLLAGHASARPLSAQTRANLETAMHGEAYAHLKYQAYADRAEADGKPELAKLFRESADVEGNEHFDREQAMLGLAGTNEANLRDAMAGEHYENTKMYLDFASQADRDGDHDAAAMFRQIAADEGDHYTQYKAALDKLAE
jgi:rubrerythrin